MTDKKFTDEEIIKALEVHSDTENPCMGVCPYSGDRYCGSKMAKEALALINRQKNALEREIYNGLKADEEIEYLKSENARLITSNSQLEARACEDRAEIERLNTVHADMTESLRLAAEANKDMQAEVERWKEKNRELDLKNYLLYDEGKAWYEQYKTARSEAIKDFAKKIKIDAERICDDNYIEGALIKYVDTLVKEMTETK